MSADEFPATVIVCALIRRAVRVKKQNKTMAEKLVRVEKSGKEFIVIFHLVIIILYVELPLT